MKKHMITVTGSNFDKAVIDNINQWVGQPSSKSIILTPKPSFGAKVEIDIKEIEVNYGFWTTLRHTLFG